MLIEGESGTGRSLVARALHEQGPRRARPLVTVHCEALPPDLLEAELFGDERGEAGGGAGPGELERAEGGTLVLDEIAALPAAAQLRLLRFLKDRTFERVGSERTLLGDVRVLATTRRDLADEVRGGRFRDDLSYRLEVVRIHLPPLRERRDDIPLLVEAFFEDAGRARRRRAAGITRGALERLVRHDWPGNVRELRSVVEGMVAFADGRRALDLSDLPPALRDLPGGAGRLEMVVGMTVAEAERLLIVSTLASVGGDKPRAAAMLGIGLRTLYRKLEEYAIR